MRRAARTDGNQLAVVNALRAIGCEVAVTSQIGNGFPDLVVGFRGKTFLLEVKDGARIPSERRLTELEQAFMNRWQRVSPGTYRIVESVKDALDAVMR